MDEKAKIVIDVFRNTLRRDPTPREISTLRRHGLTHINDVAMTLLSESDEWLERSELVTRGKNTKKRVGVTFVSPFNKKCGISTYTENLHEAILSLGFQSDVCSEVSRDRLMSRVPERNVHGSWDIFSHSDQAHRIVSTCIAIGNHAVHFQHEYGLFTSNDIFYETLCLLKECGFRVIVTLHTVMEDPSFDVFFAPVDTLVVHSEAAASRLYGYGVNNVTVIPHGTETVKEEEYKRDPRYKMASSVGFITKNKNLKETMLAALEVAETRPDFRFLIIGSTARRDSDDEYLKELESLQTENIRVENRYLHPKDLQGLLQESRFCIMNYGQTQYSTSGACHLLMTHGVASISSNSRILSDLTPEMSLKIPIENHKALVAAIHKMLDDKGLGRNFRKAARARGLETSWKNVAKSHTNIYRALQERIQ